jgi:hypothetical protein
MSAIDPGTGVNGMVVVQGLAREADARLFGGYCNPFVSTPGRRTRLCAPLPQVRRVFIGHGIIAPKKRIDAAWNPPGWDMWIDGRRVSLARFGYTDRPVDFVAPFPVGRDAVLREWSIVLVGAEGHHSVRYRTHLPQGVTDTTWKFTVGTG